ncbi:hypothetical protein [Corynebacterium aquatimens]|uniref:Membrane protein implicated in regulation of membrane protease activity n=1 Tax=Corynebacterium aquatimens TaxID=1190508 RepID=A0A931GXQ0_9CORY|nr:hypothetical protein [Corynebacterium aquatimens]MBG6122144.1 membrane protein implicated in regulation of membrane protease activity [Corynebacterium aquatimens]WJY65315.1 hypothetical protein CAQUA_02990 [Corynebacterium aquatimens]
MQVISLIVGAVFSLVAIIAVFLDQPAWVPLAALAVAGIALFIGLRERFRSMEAKPKTLDSEQKATVKRMKDEGNEAGAIRQVQLWFRNTSHEEAARIVREQT